MLIACPECNKKISSMALSCPACGCPREAFDKTPNTLSKDIQITLQRPLNKPSGRSRRKNNMKLPNGYGSIKKLSGNRRRPYAVYAPVKNNDYDDNGRVRLNSLGYYATYQEALECLTEFNKYKYNPKFAGATFGEIHEICLNTKEYNEVSDRTLETRASIKKYLEPLLNIKMQDITRQMVMDILDDCPRGYATKNNILIEIRRVIRLAMDMEILHKDVTQNIKIKHSDPVIDRNVFTAEEVNKLWDMGNCDSKTLLIMLYTGLRVNELLLNKRGNVNLEQRWIYVPPELAKNKTSNRYVPLHDKIIPLLEYFIHNSQEANSDMLMVNDYGTVTPYHNFAYRNIKRVNKELGTTHRCHDTRHTFASQGTRCGIEELYMQKMMGHKPESILYNTYTHISNEELLKKINLISY